MPIYEFQCQSCGTEVEVLQKISDDPLKDCESCGKPDMKKMVSAAAFRLSGSGWYETDFKQGKKKNLTDDGSKNDSDNKNIKSKEKTKDTKTKKVAAKSTSDKKVANKA